jgi:hypothetical protein
MAAISDIEALVIDSFWAYASNLTYAACTSTWDSLGNTTAGHTFAGYVKELNISSDEVGTFSFACSWRHCSIMDHTSQRPHSVAQQHHARPPYTVRCMYYDCPELESSLVLIIGYNLFSRFLSSDCTRRLLGSANFSLRSALSRIDIYAIKHPIPRRPRLPLSPFLAVTTNYCPSRSVRRCSTSAQVTARSPTWRT